MTIHEDDVEQFRELVAGTCDAIDELLLFRGASHDAFPNLRRGWRELRDWLDTYGRYEQAKMKVERAATAAAGQTETKTTWEAEQQGRKEIQNHWRRMPREARENLLLHVLADDCLPNAELTSRLNRALGVDPRWLPAVSDTVVRQHAMAMVATGQVTRTMGQATGFNRDVWHFQRCGKLDGPIAELEQAFHDAGDGVRGE